MGHSLPLKADRMRVESMSASNGRRLPAVLLIIGLLLLVAGGMQLISSVRDAGDQQLRSAETIIAQTFEPALASKDLAQLRRAAVVLISDPASRLSYVSIRDRRGQLLASVGSRSGMFAWLPAGGTRSARAWLYRNFSMRQTLSLEVHGELDAQVGFGVSWPAVLARTWRDWWQWLAVCLGGLLCVLVGLAGWFSRRAPTAGESGVSARPAKVRQARWPPKASATPRRSAPAAYDRAAAVLARLTGRRQPEDPASGTDDFEKIRAERLTHAARSGSHTSAVPTPDAARSGCTAAEPEDARGADPDAVAGLAADVRAREDQGVALSSIAADSGSMAGQSVPVLDDKTLDVRFHPIWRGVGYDLLAGGWATLVWRNGDGTPVAPGTLARMSEQADGLAAFTRWLVQRIALLQSNWRALGFSTVPIVLPSASKFLDFSGATDIWRDVLAAIGCERSDLLLQLDTPLPEQALPLSLRGMSTFTGGSSEVASGDDICFVPSEISGRGERLRQLLTDSHCSVVTGPLSAPASQADLLDEKARIAWFTDVHDDANLYTPRGFARLVSRYELAPL